MAKLEFDMALATAPEQNVEDPDVAEFWFGNEVLVARVPTAGEVLVFQADLADPQPGKRVRALWQLVQDLFGEEDYAKLRGYMKSGLVTEGMIYGGDGNNESGMIDTLIEVATARPTEPPIDSAPSSQSDGQRSTGRSPGKGSTRSGSPSDNSSTSPTSGSSSVSTRSRSRVPNES